MSEKAMLRTGFSEGRIPLGLDALAPVFLNEVKDL